VIPDFDEDGLLPFDSVATPEELRQSHLVTGLGVGSAAWDSAWRGELVDKVTLVYDLFMRAGGVDEFWIDGSFVENVDHPGDIDVYFTMQDGRDFLAFPGIVNALEGEDIWSWDPGRRRLYPGSTIAKPPFWGRYRVDIYPDLGRQCGIFDSDGNPLTFPEAFRQQRSTFRQKGIVRLRREI